MGETGQRPDAPSPWMSHSATTMSAAPSPTPSIAKRRILIVDDHALLRRGVTALVDNEPDLMVCATAATHGEAMTAIATAWPDLVIVDMSLGDEDGLSLLREIRASSPGLPVLVLTIHNSRAVAKRAFAAGAGGYVTKQELDDTLLAAIRSVLDGERYVSPKMKKTLATT